MSASFRLPLRVTAFLIAWGTAVFVFFVWAISSGAFGFFRGVVSPIFGGASVVEEPFVWAAMSDIAVFVVAMFLAMPFVMIVVFLFRRKRLPNQWKKLAKILEISWPAFAVRFLGMMCAEEVLFRWVPLTVLLALLPWFPKTAMVLLAAFVFAAVHLMNYEPKDRYPVMVLPQFVLGIFLSYAYVRWGFGGAVAAHTMYDAVLLVPAKAIAPHIPALEKFLQENRASPEAS